jgi:hypothetical protein
MAPSAGATAYIFHHLVLPSKLPQEDDHNAAHEQALFEVVIQALENLKCFVNNEHVGPVVAAIATVENLYSSQDSYGNVSELQLGTLLSKLMNGGTIGSVPLLVRQQNAGILVKRLSDGLNFEFFELSPKKRVSNVSWTTCSKLSSIRIEDTREQDGQRRPPQVNFRYHSEVDRPESWSARTR